MLRDPLSRDRTHPREPEVASAIDDGGASVTAGNPAGVHLALEPWGETVAHLPDLCAADRQRHTWDCVANGPFCTLKRGRPDSYGRAAVAPGAGRNTLGPHGTYLGPPPPHGGSRMEPLAARAPTELATPTDCVGLDVHKHETQVCIRAADGAVHEQRIRTTRERLTLFFGPRPRTRVLLEASTESEWVAQHLEALGHEVIVGDPTYALM